MPNTVQNFQITKARDKIMAALSDFRVKAEKMFVEKKQDSGQVIKYMEDFALHNVKCLEQENDLKGRVAFVEIVLTQILLGNVVFVNGKLLDK